MWYNFLFACKLLSVIDAVQGLPRLPRVFASTLFYQGRYDVKRLSEFRPTYEHRCEFNQDDMYHAYNACVAGENGIAALYFEMGVEPVNDKLIIFV